MSTTKLTPPNLNKMSKIRGRRQVPECKHSLKEGLFWMMRRENDGWWKKNVVNTDTKTAEKEVDNK